MLQFVQEHIEEISERLKEWIPRLNGIYEEKGNGKSGVIAEIDIMVDKYNEHFIDMHSTCSVGCAFCCHDNIAVSKLEMDRINWYMQKNHIVANKELLSKQQQAKGKDFMKLPFADRRCSLLDEKNMCTIYEVRPLICRQYHSTSSPLKCLPEEKGNIDTGILRSVEIYALMTAVIGMEANENTVFELHEELK